MNKRARKTVRISKEAEMDNYQKVEQLVNKAGCSYEEAKAALEACEWDMIDAIISLEREGKVKKETVEMSSQKAEEAEDVIPEVTPEVIAASGSRSSEDSKADDQSTGSSKKSEKATKRGRNLWNRFKSVMTKNRMVVIKSNGQQLMDIPIFIPVIALIAFFWATLALAVIAMVFGCHFHFEGEDLGKTNINSTMDKATDYAEKVRNDLTGNK